MAKRKIIGKILGLDGKAIPNGKFLIEAKGAVADLDAAYLPFAYVASDGEGNVKDSAGGELYLGCLDDPEVTVLHHFHYGNGFIRAFALSIEDGSPIEIQRLWLAGGILSAGNSLQMYVNQQLAGHKQEVEAHGWEQISDKPAAFPPSAHEHDDDYADIDHDHDEDYYLKAEVDAGFASVTAALGDIQTILDQING